MLRVLTWNMRKSPRTKILRALALEHEPDVLVLTECALAPHEVTASLNPSGLVRYHYSPGLCSRVSIYLLFLPEMIAPIHESSRLTVRAIRRPIGQEVLLVGLHLESKMHWSPESQALWAPEAMADIHEGERRANHSRTIVVGDFNMNPFEPGLVAASGFNSVMTPYLAERGWRKISGKSKELFYNPTWRALGNSAMGVPGTYYYSSGQPVEYFWNAFDQVLLRACIAKHFDEKSLRIVTEAAGASLLRKRSGIPDTRIGSDHLPLLFDVTL